MQQNDKLKFDAAPSNRAGMLDAVRGEGTNCPPGHPGRQTEI